MAQILRYINLSNFQCAHIFIQMKMFAQQDFILSANFNVYFRNIARSFSTIMYLFRAPEII